MNTEARENMVGKEQRVLYVRKVAGFHSSFQFLYHGRIYFYLFSIPKLYLRILPKCPAPQ